MGGPPGGGPPAAAAIFVALAPHIGQVTSPAGASPAAAASGSGASIAARKSFSWLNDGITVAPLSRAGRGRSTHYTSDRRRSRSAAEADSGDHTDRARPVPSEQALDPSLVADLFIVLPPLPHVIRVVMPIDRPIPARLGFPSEMALRAIDPDGLMT